VIGDHDPADDVSYPETPSGCITGPKKPIPFISSDWSDIPVCSESSMPEMNDVRYGRGLGDRVSTGDGRKDGRLQTGGTGYAEKLRGDCCY